MGEPVAMTVDVLVAGRSCMDHLAILDRWPEEDQKQSLAFRVTEGGGQGGTSACCIARLGGRVLYVGKLGSDPEGDFCKKRMESFGVNTRHIDVIKGGSTPVAYVFVTRDNGRRTILYEPNTLPRLSMADLRPALELAPLVLLLDPEVTYLSEALKTEAADGIKIVYDCERWRKGLNSMMAVADYFIPSAGFLDEDRLGFAGLTFEEKMVRLRSRIGGELVVTRGSMGAYYFSDRRLYHLPAPTVQVKDTTGAGDNFHAAFALAISEAVDIHQAVRFAVSVASLSCRDYGGRNAIPQRHEATALAETLLARVI